MSNSFKPHTLEREDVNFLFALLFLLMVGIRIACPVFFCNVRALWKLQYNARLIQEVCQTVVSEQPRNKETVASERQRKGYQAENRYISVFLLYSNSKKISDSGVT